MINIEVPKTEYKVGNINKAEAIGIGGDVISIIGNYQQAKGNIKQLRADAKARLGFGELEATRIRNDAKRVESTAVATMGAYNLDMTGNTTQAALSTIRFNSEKNAYERIFAAKNESDAMNRQADILKQQQRANLFSGISQLGGSVAKAMAGGVG